MTTETVLTEEQIQQAVQCITAEQSIVDGSVVLSNVNECILALEQAVLQSAEIQRLREENAKLLGLVKEMAEHDTYETEYDGRTYSICHGCGAQDGEDHRNPNCIYVRADAAMEKQP